MNIEDCFELGYVKKTHGLQGLIDIIIDSDSPEDYNNLESVFVEIEQKLVPFFIDTIKVRGRNALVKFDGVDDIDTSSRLKSCKLFLPLAFLPDLDQNQFFFHELVEFELVDITSGLKGIVRRIYDYPAQTLLGAEIDSKEILIPANEHIIKKVDKKNRTVQVELPDGLIDL